MVMMPEVERRSALWLLVRLLFPFSILITVSVVSGIASAVLVSLNRTLVNSISGQQSVFGIEEPLSSASIVVVAIGLILIGIRGLSAISAVLRTRAAMQAKAMLVEALCRKVGTHDEMLFNSPERLNELSLARAFAESGGIQLIEKWVSVIGSIITVSLVAGLISRLNWIYIVPILLVAVVSSLIAYRANDLRIETEKRRVGTRREYGLFISAVLSREYNSELAVFDFRNEVLRRAIGRLRCLRRQDERVTVTTEWWKTGVEVLGHLSYWSLALFVVRSVVLGEASFGDLVLYLSAASALQANGQGLLSGVVSLIDAYRQSRLFDSFMRIPPDYVGVVSLPIRKSNSLMFDNVSFSYPDMPEPAISDVSLSFSQGEIVALQGPNGSGKTTLLKLSMGLFSRYHGRIVFNGVEQRDVDRQCWLSTVTGVVQEFRRVPVSLRDYVKFGTDCSDGTVLSALEFVGLKNLVARLPYGLDTRIGRSTRLSADVSRGDLQRIALARASIRRRSIVVLDEPTASTDASHYCELNAYISALDESIVLIATHDPIVVRDCTRLITVSDGTARESPCYHPQRRNIDASAELKSMGTDSTIARRNRDRWE